MDYSSILLGNILRHGNLGNYRTRFKLLKQRWEDEKLCQDNHPYYLIIAVHLVYHPGLRLMGTVLFLCLKEKGAGLAANFNFKLHPEYEWKLRWRTKFEYSRDEKG